MHSTTRPAGEHIFLGVLPQPLILCVNRNFDTPCRVGLECCKEIKWLECKPGREYTRNCTIKNISPDVLHLSWTLPTSRLFVLEYPEPIDLSPGMSYTVKVCSLTNNFLLLAVPVAVLTCHLSLWQVAFCPLRPEPLEDQISFLCQRGRFVLPLRVCLPSVRLEVTRHLPLGC